MAGRPRQTDRDNKPAPTLSFPEKGDHVPPIARPFIKPIQTGETDEKRSRIRAYACAVMSGIVSRFQFENNGGYSKSQMQTFAKIAFDNAEIMEQEEARRYELIPYKNGSDHI